MDPLTAGLNLANGIVALVTKIFDATPEPQRAQGAADIAKTLHNVSAFLNSIQDKINAAVK